MADFIAKESHLGGANERLLDLEHYTEFRAASDHSLKLVRGIFVVICQDKEIVENDNGPIGKVFIVEDVLNDGLKDLRAGTLASPTPTAF